MKTINIILTAISTGAIAIGSIGPLAKHRQTVQPRAVARTPDIAAPKAPVKKRASIKDQLDCLASTIWYEAGNQPKAGRIAVAEVVLMRVKKSARPTTACAVVRRHKQFSFVHNGHIPRVPDERVQEMLTLARGVVNGTMRSRMHGAMYFHATGASPGWKLPLIGQIGQHLFYGDEVRS